MEEAHHLDETMGWAAGLHPTETEFLDYFV